MPVVTINTWPIAPEKKPELMKKITEVFTGTFPGMPSQAVTVIIDETPKENWASGGEQHSEKFK